MTHNRVIFVNFSKAIQSWEKDSTSKLFENFQSIETAEIVPPLPYFAIFETKKEAKLEENQRKIIIEYISQTSENFHLISAYFKGFGTSDTGTETLLIRACQESFYGLNSLYLTF